MIKEYGRVVITGQVLIERFTFDGITLEQVRREAIEWALARLSEQDLDEAIPTIEIPVR